MYLGAVIQKVTNYGTECWTTSSEKYLDSAINNVEEKLEKHKLEFTTRCDTTLSSNYYPSEYTTPELDASGLQYFQELIVLLILEVEFGIVDMFLEAALLSTHLALPHEFHLQQVYHIFGYLKKSPRRRVFMDPDH